MKNKFFLYHVIPLSLYACLVILFILSLSVSKRRPEIFSISPEEIRSGDLMIISGRNFGAVRNKSKIWLDEVFLPASAIEYWSNETVKVRIPPLSGSGLVFVETTGGKSKGALYILSERLPDRSIGAFLPGKPYLSTLNRSSFNPGDLVILTGDKLGSRQKNSTVLVNLTGGMPEDVLDTPDEEDFLPVPEESYYNWTDNQVAFFLPENAVSGPVYVRTAAGYSNPVTIEVERKGSIFEENPVERTLTQSVHIDRVGALPGNGLVLWIPRPSSRPGQKVLNAELSMDPVRSDGSLQVFHIPELASGHEYSVELTYKVGLNNIRVEVDPEEISHNYENFDALRLWLADSPDVPADYFNRTAAAVVKRERNPYNKASLIFEYLQWKLDPDREDKGYDYTQWMTERKADALGYAAFFTALCRAADVPARIVSGVWADLEKATGVPHFWSEFYVPGFGWYPVDPSAPDGMLDEYLSEQENPPGGWGYLDNRYVAFSRGNLRGIPFSEISRRIDFQFYSQQNIFEEWIGHLESCSVQWSPVTFPE